MIDVYGYEGKYKVDTGGGLSMRNNRWKAYARKADSVWEADLRDGIFKEWDYHPDKISYTIPHTYEPDFRRGNILIEAKGRFADSAEARKYKHIRDALPDDGTELVFVFYNPKTPMPFAKVRKRCGTKQTHAEWAEKNKFRWYTEETIKELINE